jgi:glycosyltransferase involved in cell wall biosynthesis
MKTLLYICEQWPNPYKPTWDLQIAEFIAAGFHIDVVHCGKHERGPVWLDDAVEKGIISISLYPSTLRKIPAAFIKIAPWLRMIKRWKNLRTALKGERDIKQNLLGCLRLSCIPKTDYDQVLVKNLNCAADYIPLLKIIHCRNNASVYYHGGAVEGVPASYMQHRKKIFDSFNLFFTNTNFSRKELIGLGCLESKAIAIPVGLDTKSGFKPNQSPKPDGVLRLLSACRLSREKGVIYAIQAVESLIAKGHRNLRYDILGNGLEEPALREYVKSRKLENWIYFHGHQPNAVVVSSYMPNADAFINTCFPIETWTETQCVAIQEAGLCQVPSIASRCGGIPEVIVDGSTGLLTEIHSVESIAAAIEKLYLMHSDELHMMGRAAADFTIQKFDVEVVTRNLLEAMSTTAALDACCPQPQDTGNQAAGMQPE